MSYLRRLPATLIHAGFTSSNHGGAERRIRTPDGPVDLSFSGTAVPKMVDSRTLVKAVTLIAFREGQKFRQREIEAILDKKIGLDIKEQRA